MKIRIYDYSDDADNSAIVSECDLRDCFDEDDDEYLEAAAEIKISGRYWIGGGATPLMLLQRVQ